MGFSEFELVLVQLFCLIQVFMGISDSCLVRIDVLLYSPWSVDRLDHYLLHIKVGIP